MYSKIDARFWDDEKVLTLSPDARYLLIYLLTTKHRNVLGCYQLPKAYALEDTRLPEKRFSNAWRELFGSGIAIYEEDTRMILLKNFLRYNPIENPNQVKGALTKLEGLPRSDLLHTVYAHLEGLVTEAGKPYLKPLLEALPKQFRKPFRNGCGNPSETLSEPLPQPVNSNRPVDFINVIAWRNTADLCARYLTKGRQAAVIGTWQNRSYEDKDGNKRTVAECIADDVQFLGGPRREAAPQAYEGYDDPFPEE